MIRYPSLQYKELPISILVIVSILSIIGLIVLNSISQDEYGGFFSAPFNKQLFFLVPSIFLAFIILFIPRYTIHKYSYPLYVIGILMVLLPFTGSSHAGTYRWFNIPGSNFSIQPSEFAKVFTVLFLARYLSDHNLKMKKFTSIIIPIGLVLIPTTIVMNQPDLGTAIVMMTPVLPMLYWSGA